MNTQRFAYGILDAGARVERAMRILKHHLHMPPRRAQFAAIKRQPVASFKTDRAFVGRDQPHQDACQCRFSAAGGAGKPKRLAGLKRKGYIGQCFHRACAGPVGFREVLYAQKGFVHDAASLIRGGVERSR